jgi:hypothetical protein
MCRDWLCDDGRTHNGAWESRCDKRSVSGSQTLVPSCPGHQCFLNPDVSFMHRTSLSYILTFLPYKGNGCFLYPVSRTHRTTVIQLIIKKEEANPERDAERFEQDLRLLLDEAAALHVAAGAQARAAWAKTRAEAAQRVAQEEQRAQEACEARRRLRQEARERVWGVGDEGERKEGAGEGEETAEEASARARAEQSRRELEEMAPPEPKPFDERRAKKRAIKELRRWAD